MEMARNPAAMREHMRSQDRQLSNIEVSELVINRSVQSCFSSQVLAFESTEFTWRIQCLGPNVHRDTGTNDGRSPGVCE